MARDEERDHKHQDIEDIFELETELFPCLVDMRFLGVRVDVRSSASRIKRETIIAEEKAMLTKSKKRNRSRYPNMGCSIDCASF